MSLLTTILPLATGIVGVIALIVGILLSRRPREDVEGGTSATSSELAAAEPDDADRSAGSATLPSLVPGLDDEPHEATAASPAVEQEAAAPEAVQAEAVQAEAPAAEAADASQAPAAESEAAESEAKADSPKADSPKAEEAPAEAATAEMSAAAAAESPEAATANAPANAPATTSKRGRRGTPRR